MGGVVGPEWGGKACDGAMLLSNPASAHVTVFSFIIFNPFFFCLVLQKFPLLRLKSLTYPTIHVNFKFVAVKGEGTHLNQSETGNPR